MSLRGAALADRLIRTLPASSPTLFNPWTSRCLHDLETQAPAYRRARLAAHLDCDARLILVGEAVGYQGGRYSGIAFTSERLLGEGRIPRIEPTARLTRRALPFSEPSATIVWRELEQLGLHAHTVLWNALPLHPYRGDRPWSNRTPTKAELALGRVAMRILGEAYPGAVIVAVGRHSQTLLGDVLERGVPGVRHPAYGGASEFARGLRAVLGVT
ncbi:MAG: Uracil glycosylase superfamily protein [Panacagrimonas sp.]|jgi:uracil-DNA glycosylase|nr:uracil-DNA glycosylase [Panacagrimonas sp.]MCC2656733.1 Uracil glycosylase superfamily protein [Panacagrimonas sp.]